jgi:hypothetical protein
MMMMIEQLEKNTAIIWTIKVAQVSHLQAAHIIKNVFPFYHRNNTFYSLQSLLSSYHKRKYGSSILIYV